MTPDGHPTYHLTQAALREPDLTITPQAVVEGFYLCRDSSRYRNCRISGILGLVLPSELQR